MIELWVFLIFFFAIFVQTIIGFGSALIAMTFLIQLLGLQIATPLFALCVMIFELGILLYFRHAFHWRSIQHVLITTIIGVPVGILMLNTLPERPLLILVGSVTVAYALYSLFQPKIASMPYRVGYLVGFIAGVLGGAYNISGPPYVIFGHGRKWSPSEFRSNLQGLFLVGAVVAVAGHYRTGKYTQELIHYVWFALPAGGLAMLGGFWLDQFIRPELFYKATLILLLIVGTRLILNI